MSESEWPKISLTNPVDPSGHPMIEILGTRLGKGDRLFVERADVPSEARDGWIAHVSEISDWNEIISIRVENARPGARNLRVQFDPLNPPKKFRTHP